jgi:hypothetical protein
MTTKTELDARLDALKASIDAQLGNCPPEPPPEQRAEQLPSWPEPVRGGPNALLRSALFAGIHSKKRTELGTRPRPDEPRKGVTVAAQDGITITFAGDQLNQYDADVFFETLHRARLHPLETECLFRGYDFLKAIGRSNAQPNYDDLHNSLTRLRNGNLVVEWKINGRHYEFNGSLISHYVREKNTKLYKVTFAKEINVLFAPACWTRLEWDERQLLKGHPLAQWLHSYFSTHAEPYPVSVKFLHEKSGSKHALLKNFRIDLKKALATLEKRLGWKATWNGDLVTVTRPPSPSQARHLITKQAARNGKREPKREGKGLTPASRTLPGMKKKARI